MPLKQPQNSVALYAKLHEEQATYALLDVVPLLLSKFVLLTVKVIVELCPLDNPVTVIVLVETETEPAETVAE
jgi:hypothetical protein